MFALVVNARDPKAKKRDFNIKKALDLVINELNQQYQLDFHRPLKVSGNSEIRGVLSKGIYVLEICDRLNYMLDNYELTFGIGFVEHREDKAKAIEKGFSLAQAGLKRLADDNDYGNNKIYINLGRRNSLENIVNESLRLADFVSSRWRQSQIDLVKYLILTYGYMEKFVQKDVAKVMNVSAQNFNQQLKNSGYYNLIRLKREVTIILEQYRRTYYRN
ncbi:MAG TPA: hypothetical protein GX741_04305 [Erysipelothrix sp.]|nr:hypothetical protein [Erysipelothrix sp.]